jgi:hypothetical protein
LTLGVIYYYYILYYYTYTIIIYIYYSQYSFLPLLFYSPSSLSSAPSNIHSILVGTYIYLFILSYTIIILLYTFYLILYSPILLIYLQFCSPSLLPLSLLLLQTQPSQYSFYTCRYLHILIYIQSISQSE